MTVSSAELTGLLGEILGEAHGWHVKKIYQPDDALLVFSFHESKRRLFICAAPGLGRIYLTSVREKMDETPAPFAQQLRKHLSGERFFGFAKEKGERLFALLIGQKQVWVRLFGQSGFLLCEGDGTILGSAGFADAPRPGGVFSPPAPAGFDEEPVHVKGSLCAAIEARYADKGEAARLEQERHVIIAAANAELKKIRNLIAGLERDRVKLQGFAAYKEYGGLCRTYYHELKRGLSEIMLTDPATGEAVTIPLSPELSPKENVEALYRKYKKYVTGMAKLEKTLTTARGRQAFLEEKIAAARSAKAVEELGVPSAKKPKKEKPAPKDSEGSTFRKFISADGYDMFVGRNDRQNDELVKMGKGNDLWFHIRDFPGSHVLVRMKKGGDIPRGTIEEAARLAVKFSSRAKDGKGTVVYTHVKYLKKPKGAAPGKVLVLREKTLSVSL
ncbi:MAG: DUF814 domain-containing protein [Nitrospinae bacterium]|nr:DUF814 domain-containing protein [Nitrospinota bacterium]